MSSRRWLPIGLGPLPILAHIPFSAMPAARAKSSDLAFHSTEIAFQSSDIAFQSSDIAFHTALCC